MIACLVVSEIIWTKGAIVRRVAVRQAELAMGDHPCSPSESLVVECQVGDCPIERPVVGCLPAVGVVIQGPCQTLKISTGPHYRPEVCHEVESLVQIAN